MSEVVIAVIALVLVFVVFMSRTVFLQNEIYRPVEEGVGGSHLRRLRMWFYVFFWGGASVAIAGSFARSNWLRGTGDVMWLASIPPFVIRHVEMKRQFRRRREHE
jgi:hypothetical protein